MVFASDVQAVIHATWDVQHAQHVSMQEVEERNVWVNVLPASDRESESVSEKYNTSAGHEENAWRKCNSHSISMHEPCSGGCRKVSVQLQQI